MDLHIRNVSEEFLALLQGVACKAKESEGKALITSVSLYDVFIANGGLQHPVTIKGGAGGRHV